MSKYSEWHQEYYYTKKGEPRKVINCYKCNTLTMKLIYIDRTFISGDYHRYACTKCETEDGAIL